jgi:predicted transposase/invertase (TIGR01784 family)
VAEPTTPHDALFKWTFSQVAYARAELRSILPAPVLDRVDLDTLELCSGAFVDKALSASYSDLLYQVRIAGKRGLLYVLFEHQSTPDDAMPLRLLGYLVRILELEVRTRRNAKEAVLPLPVVLPVVLHHSDTGWTRAAQFRELFDSELLAEPEIARLVPRFEFVLDDLSHLTDEALRQRALDQVSSLTLWALRDARTPARLLATVHNWVDTMQKLLRAPSGAEAFQVIFHHIALVAQEPVAEQVLEIVLSEAPTAEEAMTTLAEKWISEGRKQGREEGKAEGREEACRSLLQQLLVSKFGAALEPYISERIARAPEHQLTAWTTRILSASSIDEVFAS